MIRLQLVIYLCIDSARSMYDACVITSVLSTWLIDKRSLKSRLVLKTEIGRLILYSIVLIHLILPTYI